MISCSKLTSWPQNWKSYERGRSCQLCGKISVCYEVNLRIKKFETHFNHELSDNFTCVTTTSKSPICVKWFQMIFTRYLFFFTSIQARFLQRPTENFNRFRNRIYILVEWKKSAGGDFFRKQTVTTAWCSFWVEWS